MIGENGMSFSRCLLILALVAVMPFRAPAQEGKVVVENVTSKELKRAAHRMGITTDQLKNARLALQEATDLILNAKAVQASQVTSLGYLWMQVYRTRAQGALEAVYRRLKTLATSAPDAPAYQAATAAAQSVLYTCSQLDPENALLMSSQWPNPPSSYGNAVTNLPQGMQKPLQELMLQRLVTQDPERALALLPEATAEQRNYSIVGRLAQQLAIKGKREQALALVDRAIADFQQQQPDALMVSDFAVLMQQLPGLDANRFLLAVRLLTQPAAASTVSEGSPSSVEIAGGELTVSAAESALLTALRGLTSRPDLIAKALDQMPGLKAKLERIGGIDGYLNQAGSAASVTVASASEAAAKRTSGSDRAGAEGSKASLLYAQLRGKTAKNQAWVRQQLSNSIRDPEQVPVLFGLAQLSYSDDPDLGGMALEVAEPLVFQIQSLQPRAAALRNLIQLYRDYDGEVGVNLLREGFLLAAKMRGEEEANSGSAADRLYSAAEPLEAMIVSQTARQDFAAAMRYVRTMSDEARKFNSLIQIVQSLQLRR
jgi:hypothetical protein